MSIFNKIFPRVRVEFGSKADQPPPTQRFIQAAGRGDLEGMKKAAADGAYKIGHDENGDNALTLAARNGEVEAMDACVYEYGIPVDLPGTHRDTALCVALDSWQPLAAEKAAQMQASVYPKEVEGIRTRSAVPKLAKAIEDNMGYTVQHGYAERGGGYYKRKFLNEDWSRAYAAVLRRVFSPEQFGSVKHIQQRARNLPNLLRELHTHDGAASVGLYVAEARSFLAAVQKRKESSRVESKDPGPEASSTDPEPAP